MALPKRKTPKSKQGKRRSHLAKDAPTVVNCPQCGSPRLPHTICLACGTYAGREVISQEKPEKKKNEKQAKE
jgi:large subunit ribosomal protein L32